MAASSLCFAVIAASFALLAASVSSLQPTVFSVGDEKGWTVPSGNGTESYNHWAKRNRFQVGDVLEFKYANDSVLRVSHDDYKQCSTEIPMSRFTDGDTKFAFDTFGPFYFISGVPGHCEAGQRMIARVMAPSTLTGGAPAAAPGMPPATTPVVPAGAPVPATSSTSRDIGAPPPSGSSDSSSTGGAAASTPSPMPEASGASTRGVLSVVSSIVLGFMVVAVISLFVLA
ncbi:hypothetical protein QOZ80_2AG0143970 [Eleusine coracana subsp. coracana]|nr:hypothetical protein QOZ80_2AG0143970 [Eleusine coracana subsp. coracana]